MAEPRADQDPDQDPASPTAGGASGGRSGVALALSVAGGLGLAASSSGAWVRREITSEIADVPRADVVTTAGVELSGAVLPLGVAAMAAGLLLAALRGRARVGTAGALLAIGVGAIIAVALGLVRAAGADGIIAPAAWFGLLAAAGPLLAGALALRPAPPPRLSARYDLDPDDTEDPEEAEWLLASDDEDPDANQEGTSGGADETST